MADLTKPVSRVQVRTLVEFALRRGDLGGEAIFVGSNRALAGIRGHQQIQRSRPAGYEKEVPLSYGIETPEFRLQIEGRIDGLLRSGDSVLVEEIKTVTRGWDETADPLHWAQARTYAAIYCQQNECDSIEVKLLYLNLDTGEMTELIERPAREELDEFLSRTVEIYIRWMTEQQRWAVLRNGSIARLPFPFEQYRAGQRELAIAAYKAVAKGERLFAEAPTGIGKTVSVLFPAIKALGEGKIERAFYLTARTSGRGVAEKAADDLRRGGLKLRSVTLTAREKICVQAGSPCDPAQCPLAGGYYDRLHGAMRSALARETITRPVLEEVSREHLVCPFELSLDLSRWVDLVVCDYNYLFDPKVYLRRHFDQPADYAFLIDEAHNLVDRGREMFSAELGAEEIREVRRSLGRAVPKCSRALGKLATGLAQCAAGLESEADPREARDGELELNLFAARDGVAPEGGATTQKVDSNVPAALGQWQPVSGFVAGRGGLFVSRGLPAALIPKLDLALKETEQWLARNEPASFRDSLLDLYFRLHSFRRTADLFDCRFATLAKPGRFASVKLFCLDSSHLLRQALERGRAAVLFSATLSPIDYYRDLLGGSADDRVLQLSSPFPSGNLAVVVQDRIRTQYNARDLTLSQVAREVGTMVKAKRGNYMVYLPSYAYLENLRTAFAALWPDIELLAQKPGMSEQDRDQFLSAFTERRRESLVGFAVMGGVFGEGIDLVGERLIGAIIVGVGLPQLCVERDLIASHFQAMNGAGFDYAYTFPGMNRVLQAIGRVIRSENDRGVVLLIDTRYAQTRYRRLFPPWWQVRRAGDPDSLNKALGQFWSAINETTQPIAELPPESLAGAAPNLV